jgi:predicted metal-binding membrane protein
MPVPSGNDRAPAAIRRPLDGIGVHVILIAVAAIGWWWSARMAAEMTGGVSDMGSMGSMGSMGAESFMSLAAFTVAWLAMMTAMMFPAVSPVVKLYGRGAAAGRVAPLPFFVAGYIVVWTSLGLPAYFAWRALMDPIAAAEVWAARLAGGVLIGAALWQLTPLKAACLRHCRSPMSLFMHFGGSVTRPLGAIRMGATHGAYCVGCCWALMAILIAFGTMNLGWMLALAALILLEKNASWGERLAQWVPGGFVALGIVLFVRPEVLSSLT